MRRAARENAIADSPWASASRENESEFTIRRQPDAKPERKGAAVLVPRRERLYRP